MEKNTIIFDLDGTVADVTARRELATKPNGKIDWNIFLNPDNIKLDMANKPVIRTAQLFAEAGFTIAILSGRSDKTINTTRSWLAHNKMPFHKLILRDRDRIFMPDEQLKKQFLDSHIDIDDVFFVVDDRQKVVDMWRSLGLNVFQVADGNF